MCQVMTEQSVGRPSVMTPEVIGKLEGCFSVGATDLQACFIAGISKDALYDYQKLHPEFHERKEALKAMTSYQARKNVADSVANGKMEDSKWYLERKDKEEFGQKSSLDIGGQKDNPLNSHHTVTFVEPDKPSG